jgi:hypothetical protein
MNHVHITSPRVEASAPVSSLASAGRPARQEAHRVSSSLPHRVRVYGAVQSASDEREAELLDIAVLGYN